MPESSVVSAWELGLRLRERRDHLALSVASVAKAVKMQQPNLSAVETGRKKLTVANLAKLAKLYELGLDELAELKELQVQADQRDWYHSYTWLFSEEFVRYLGLESGAARISTFQCALIPGLLQTENYAKAVIRGGSPYIRLTEVDPRAEVRIARQRRLEGANPLRVTALLGEAVLRQQVGGPEVMRGQLESLTRFATEKAHIDIRVLPYSAGAHPVLGGPFDVISFDSPRLPDMVWQETLTSTALLDRQQLVREHTVAFEEAVNTALSVDDSLEFIRDIAKEMM